MLISPLQRHLLKQFKDSENVESYDSRQMSRAIFLCKLQRVYELKTDLAKTFKTCFHQTSNSQQQQALIVNMYVVSTGAVTFREDAPRTRKTTLRFALSRVAVRTQVSAYESVVSYSTAMKDYRNAYITLKIMKDKFLHQIGMASLALQLHHSFNEESDLYYMTKALRMMHLNTHWSYSEFKPMGLDKSSPENVRCKYMVEPNGVVQFIDDGKATLAQLRQVTENVPA